MKLSSAFLASIYLLAASPVLSYGDAEKAPAVADYAPEPSPEPAYVPEVETKPEGSYPEQHHPYTGGKSHHTGGKSTGKHTGGHSGGAYYPGKSKGKSTGKHTGGKSGSAYYPGKSRKH